LKWEKCICLSPADAIVTIDEDTYLTIARPAEAVYKEKKSQFLAFAYPVQTEAEVKDQLQALRKKYYDARHHCYAYMLGENKEIFRANDDGEPNHSAGDPILGQIRARQLTQVLVVVVRYFGGIKLGVGGLVQAYKTAASEALEQAEIVERVMTCPLQYQIDYIRLNEVMKVVKDYELEVVDQQFENTCSIRLRVRKKWAEEVKAKLEKIGEPL
jgi:uncharacterized YigZ family protein